MRTVVSILRLVEPFKGSLLLLDVPLRLPFLTFHKVYLDGSISMDGAGFDLKLMDVHDSGLKLLLSTSPLLFGSVRQLAGGWLPLEGLLPG